MSDHGLFAYMAAMGVLSVGGGFYTVARAERLARKNKEHVESGEETYFEEHRSWEAYGNRPATDPTLVRRGGFSLVAFGFISLLAAIFVYYT